jgi:DNA-binding NarL/FixJ family response regulator
MSVIRVLVVDDHPVVRHGVRSLLASCEDIEVIGEAADASDALAQVQSLSPAVVLLDIRMPGASGLELAHQLRTVRPEIKLIVLTTYDDDDYLFDALRFGVQAYLLKSTSYQVLASVIRSVYAGERFISPTQVTKVLREFESLAKQKARYDSGLSDEELQLLQHMASGASNAEITARMHWSEATIKRRIQDIITKMNVANRVQAVAEAIRRGLI